MGVTSVYMSVRGGDIVFLWILLGMSYCVAYAFEFVLNSIPYIRNICQRYRYNFFNAGMNFTFIKVAFDSSVNLTAINFETLQE